MATATLSIPRTHPRQPATRLGRGASATSAAVLSIIGSMLAIGVAATGLLVVPVAALLVFGPAMLALF